MLYLILEKPSPSKKLNEIKNKKFKNLKISFLDRKKIAKKITFFSKFDNRFLVFFSKKKDFFNFF
jgi:hypothetical protein